MNVGDTERYSKNLEGKKLFKNGEAFLKRKPVMFTLSPGENQWSKAPEDWPQVEPCPGKLRLSRSVAPIP